MKNSKKERTLVLIKPDGVQRSLIGEIISRFERVGLKIAGLKFFIPSQEQISKQYGASREEIEALGQRSIDNQAKIGRQVKEAPYQQGLMIVERLKKLMTSSPIVAMVLEGNEAVGVTKKLVGATEPLNSDVGTIRGDFTIDSYALADSDGRAVRNIVHRSGSLEEAEKEIKIWFDPKEIVNYKLVAEKILYDVNLDGLLE